MVTLYRNTTDYTLPFDTAARQIQVTCINQNFKKNSVTFQKKHTQESLQVVPFCSQAVPSALRLRSESLPSSLLCDFFKGPLLSDGLLLSGGPLLSGFDNRKVKY